MRTLKVFLLMSVFISLTAGINSQTLSDGLRLSMPGLKSNAKALGMGNAYTSLSDDFSAASFNPAGFGFLRQMQFAGSIGYDKFDNDAVLFGNGSAISNSSTKLDNFSFAFPFPTIRGSFVFAIGYSRDVNFNRALSFDGYNSSNHSLIQDLASQNDDLIYNLGLSYPINDGGGNYLFDTTRINGMLNQSGDIIEEGGVGRWSFAGAIEVAPNAFIGATFNAINGSFKRTRNYFEDDINDVYGTNFLLDPNDNRTAGFNSFYFNELLDWEISGYDIKFGFLYQLRNVARFGLTVKFPSNYTINEKYYVKGESEFASGTNFTDEIFYEDYQYDVSTPFEFSLGSSMNLFGLILSGDINFIDYTQIEFSDGLELSLETQLNQDANFAFRETVNFNLGAEYVIPGTNFSLRGGFIYNQSPYEGDPSERDRKYVTAGAGFMVEETIGIDLALARGWWEDIGDNYGAGLSRTFQEITVNHFIVSIAYRF